MAFPSVRAVGTDYNTTGATSHVIDMPDSIVSGNLLFCWFSHDDESSQETVTWPAAKPWTEFVNADTGSSAGINIAYRIATSSEDASITVTTGTSEAVSAKIFEVQNWHGSAAPEATTAAGASGDPDPPNLAPTWGAADTFWIAMCGLNGGTGAWTYPTGYTGDQYSLVTGGAGSTGLGLCTKAANAASDNPAPGAFSSSGWAAATVAVRPAAGSVLVGSAAGLASQIGALVGSGALVAASAGLATGSGTLIGFLPADGSSAGVATLTGVLIAVVNAVGSSAGTASLVGTLTGNGALVGASAGLASVSGTMAGAGAMTGAVSGVASLAGSLTGAGELLGSAVGIATQTGTLSELGGSALIGSSAGLSSVAATLTASGILSGQAVGSATADATITAGGILIGTVTGIATLSGVLTGPSFFGSGTRTIYRAAAREVATVDRGGL